MVRTFSTLSQVVSNCTGLLDNCSLKASAICLSNCTDEILAKLLWNSILSKQHSSKAPDTAYKVQVGMDDKNNVVIMPLTKEVVESGALDECCLLKIEFHKSFARISSVQLLKQISEALRIQLSNKPIQFETTWDSVENVLTIKTGGQ